MTQLPISGTTRPESRPTIRTEGREGEGPLFTQERDQLARREARAQLDLFAPAPADYARGDLVLVRGVVGRVVFTGENGRVLVNLPDEAGGRYEQFQDPAGLVRA